MDSSSSSNPSILLPFLLLALSATFLPGPATSDLTADKQTLLKLNTELNKPWDSSIDPCKWTAVTCGVDGVQNITAESSGLTGKITNTICDLLLLTYLNLFNNSLTGDLSAFTTCVSLTHLDASNNHFNGPIPVSISKLKKLQFLDISNNKIDGPIANELGLLPELSFLSLSFNYLKGGLPTAIVVHSKLKHIDIMNNPLNSVISEVNVTDPSKVLPSLEEFDISSSNLQGELHDYLSSNLKHVILSNNSLGGTIPKNLLTSPTMNTLFLWKNNFGGNISVINMPSLLSLDLSENKLSGNIPSGIVNSTKIKYLALFDNNLNGDLPQGIANFTSLEGIRIYNNQLTGTLPPNLGENSEIQSIDFSNNSLGGNIPNNLCVKRRLRIVYLFSNSFEGVIPDELGNCRTLEILDLHSNNLTGAIPIGLGNLRKLYRLNLSFNNLEGEIPISLQKKKFTNSFLGNAKLCANSWSSYPKCHVS